MYVCVCVHTHACRPRHASPCATELHMTSIWEQWDSDLITNSLLLIKTCRLHPSFSTPSFLLLPLYSLPLFLFPPCIPPPLSSPRLTPSLLLSPALGSHHSAVSPLLVSKRGPFSSSPESHLCTPILYALFYIFLQFQYVSKCFMWFSFVIFTFKKPH